MRKLLLIPPIIAIIAGILLFVVYQKANELKNQGDILLGQKKYQEAMLYYHDAQNILPFLPGLSDSISSTDLLSSSELEYSGIVDTDYAEIQNIPALVNIAPVQLNAGDLFVPILMYHHIRINPKPNDPIWASLNVTPADLDNELNYLSTHNFHAITLNNLSDAMNGSALPDKPIILTFDDGYENFYESAFPLLKKYNMKAIEFVITQVEGAPAYLTWDQIIALDKSGLVEIGAHTKHHPFLTDLTQTSAINEIEGSKSDIESHLGHTINWFAYPYGSYNNFIISETQKAGFSGAVSTNYSTVQNKNKLFVLPRIQVDGRFTLDEFIRRIAK